MAASKSPLRLWRASVNAPFMYPNSSLSSRVSGRAPQLTLTKGPLVRPDSPWIAFATSSLPVPLSPGDEHGGAGRGDGPDHLEERRHHLGDADHPVEAVGLADLAPEAEVLLAEAAVGQRVADDDAQLVHGRRA